MKNLDKIIDKYGYGKRFPPLEQPRQVGRLQLGWRVEMTGFKKGFEVLESVNDGKQIWSYLQNEYRDWFSIIPEPSNEFRIGLIQESVKRSKESKKKCNQCGIERAKSQYQRYSRGLAKACNKCKKR